MIKASPKRLISFFAILCALILAIHFSDVQTRKPSHLFDLIESSEFKAENKGMMDLLESEVMAKPVETIEEQAKKL